MEAHEGTSLGGTLPNLDQSLVTDSSINLDDSGNYSSTSSTHECYSPITNDASLEQSCFLYKGMLREKEQSLCLAIQDLRKLRSELERLGKSEQWYKKELRAQKNSRLEALERLYAQERKYMQENQRLQKECVRLYEKCSAIEKELEEQRTKAVDQLAAEGEEQNVRHSVHHTELSFEMQQQRALIIDQQGLINVLRKQKRSLLDDMQRLTDEKNDKVLALERAVASMSSENNTVTRKCKQLLNERQDVANRLNAHAASLTEATAEKVCLQQTISDLREQVKVQEHLLALKEGEILDLQARFRANMHNEANVDEVHRLSVAYHEAVNAKTGEIRSLKTSLLQLQEELASQANLQAHSEEQARVIEQLTFTLDTRQYELASLQEADDIKAQQINQLQTSLETFHNDRDSNAGQLLMADVRGFQGELITSHEKYAAMCALIEQTRFALEMREIEQAKLQFAGDHDRREIAELRNKLRDYLQQTTALSTRIADLEADREQRAAQKVELEARLHELSHELHAQQLPSDKLATPLTSAEETPYVVLQLELAQRTQECCELARRVEEKSAAMRQMQRSLLTNDARLFKEFRAQQRKSLALAETAARTSKELEQLTRDHAHLRTGMEQLHEARQRLEAELLSVQNRSASQCTDQAVQTENDAGYEDGRLQARVLQLEEQVLMATVGDGAKSSERVQLIQKLIDQQNSKVQQLNTAQAEWEELLSVLTATQRQEEANRCELALKRCELEELNALFADQNEQLHRLEQHSRRVEQDQQIEAARLQDTFQEQLSAIECELQATVSENEDHKAQITELRCTNERLQQHLNEDYAREVAVNSNQLRSLHSQVARLQQERDQYAERQQVMEQQIAVLQTAKQQDAVRKPEWSFQQRCSSEADTEDHQSVTSACAESVPESSCESQTHRIEGDGVRTFTRVLESEYRRKLKRYDVHIGTLLGNIKSLKRALRSAEQKAANARSSVSASDAADKLRHAKRQLEEMRLKYEQSQANVRMLEEKLEVTLNRFEASDQGKVAQAGSAQPDEVVHEVPNLIDDYKKLIRVSAARTRRLNTCAILELIQRSNNCVPNLTDLEMSVNNLRMDVQQFLHSRWEHKTASSLSCYQFSGMHPPGKKPSLMDELRIAEQF